MLNHDLRNSIPQLSVNDEVVLVRKREAAVVERSGEDVYIHYLNTDKRMDEWVKEAEVQPLPQRQNGSTRATRLKRKRSKSMEAPTRLPPTPSPTRPAHPTDLLQETKEQDEEAVEEHKHITAKRNFDQVIFDGWQMKTWYYSPYPIADDDVPPSVLSNGLPGDAAGSRRAHGHSERNSPAVPGGPAAPTLRAHGRTAELLASSGVGKVGPHEEAKLWVCDRCFKYMRDGSSWELHLKWCDYKHPPGRKVYQRGAHTIWEVDGAEQKLYCQNLALFGKLFIDVKTIFFDCDNFMFYLLTDADSQRDHVLGFFSKEKVSYDDWNLACIITFPPYQKKGYGMLLIEFSYEISRRAGKLGTPERPLSDLGLRSYLAYWVSELVRFFRRLLGTEPEDSAFSPGHRRSSSWTRKKKNKGFAGELDIDGPSAAVVERSEPAFGSIRTTHTTASSSGSEISHLTIQCTLLDIAKATGLRHEDVAFAMEDCGMLLRRKKSGGDAAQDMVVVSADMVETVARERGVKQKCILDPAHVLL